MFFRRRIRRRKRRNKICLRFLDIDSNQNGILHYNGKYKDDAHKIKIKSFCYIFSGIDANGYRIINFNTNCLLNINKIKPEFCTYNVSASDIICDRFETTKSDNISN